MIVRPQHVHWKDYPDMRGLIGFTAAKYVDARDAIPHSWEEVARGGKLRRKRKRCIIYGRNTTASGGQLGAGFGVGSDSLKSRSPNDTTTPSPNNFT